MPGPQAVQNLQMPHPRDWQGGQMPRSNQRAGGLGAGVIDWCISFRLELTLTLVPLGQGQTSTFARD